MIVPMNVRRKIPLGFFASNWKTVIPKMVRKPVRRSWAAFRRGLAFSRASYRYLVVILEVGQVVASEGLSCAMEIIGEEERILGTRIKLGRV